MQYNNTEIKELFKIKSDEGFKEFVVDKKKLDRLIENQSASFHEL